MKTLNHGQKNEITDPKQQIIHTEAATSDLATLLTEPKKLHRARNKRQHSYKYS